jgi:hypothetical protein
MGVAYRLRFLHSSGSPALSRLFATSLTPIAVPASVCAFSGDYSAAVLDAGSGANYVWTIENGVVTSGQGTRTITFHAGSGGAVTLHVRVGVPGGGCVREQSASVSIDTSPDCPAAGGFFTLAPCRLADTRDAEGPSGGPALSSGASRAFPVAGSCGIPATARAVAANLTVITPTQPGFLTAYPAGKPIPTSSTLNFRAGSIRANNAILLLGPAGTVGVFCSLSAPGSVHLAIDVTGYFQ